MFADLVRPISGLETDAQLRLWHFVAMLFGDFNEVDVPRTHCTIVQTYAAVYQLLHSGFVEADGTYLGDWMPPFLPWVFEAMGKGPRFAESKFRCNELLCSVLAANVSARPQLPIRVLDSFLPHLATVLLRADAALAYTTLRMCWAIVGQNLPGATLLYPRLVEVCLLCIRRMPVSAVRLAQASSMLGTTAAGGSRAYASSSQRSSSLRGLKQALMSHSGAQGSPRHAPNTVARAATSTPMASAAAATSVSL